MPGTAANASVWCRPLQWKKRMLDAALDGSESRKPSTSV